MNRIISSGVVNRQTTFRQKLEILQRAAKRQNTTKLQNIFRTEIKKSVFAEFFYSLQKF